ncbi:MAG: hypothetical protein ACP6IY_05020 [Promethearchaeia archaeon]
MNEAKKIILTGPPGAGKTTIKKVFFDCVNPIKLLEQSLEPTRGVDSNIYSFFDAQLGVFDLAGQENENWFSRDKDIFKDSSLILCVFDIRNSLKTIITFLRDVYKLKNELRLYDCLIYTFLHKIDLKTPSYVFNKLNAIKSFFKIKCPELYSINIYKTSIEKRFFFDTFSILLDVITQIFKKEFISINPQEFENLKLELSILLYYDDSVKYSKHDVAYKFNLNSSELNFHLNRLEKMGFIEFDEEIPSVFKITDRGKFFKIGMLRESSKVAEMKNNKQIELYYTFLNLKRKEK